MIETESNSSRKQLRCVLLVGLILLFLPHLVEGAGRNYYYLHVASLRKETNALRFENKLKRAGESTVVRHEEVADRGYWYRVYVGPFSTFKEANLKGIELKKKGLTDYFVVRKKRSPLRSNLREKPSEVRKKRPPPEKAVTIAKPYPKKSVPSKRKPMVKVPAEKRLLEKTAVPIVVPPPKKAPVAEKPPPLPLAETPKKIKVKPSRKAFRRGLGRNVLKGRFALGYQHTYREVQTELTKRKRVTSDSTSTKVEEVSISGDLKDDFPTSMHMDTLRVRFGLTDYLEVFGDVGAAYDDLSDLSPAYSGGVRLNLFEIEEGRIRGFYGAIQGDYLAGELTEELTSNLGNKWKEESDWQQFTGKVELGLVRPRFAAYAGGTYFVYRENTVRMQRENLPPSLTSNKFQDELEEENSFGAFGGVDIYFTPALLLNIEGEVISQERISVGLEYRF
jgi:hypothetical protein